MAFNKIGFLTASAGNPTGIGDYIRKLDAAGIPAVVACNDGTTGLGDAWALLEKGSKVPHVLAYRVVAPVAGLHSEHFSVPDYTMEPSAAARKHYALVEPQISPDVKKRKQHTWWFPVNEVRAQRSKGDVQYNDMNAWDWMGAFCTAFAKIALDNGYRVSMPQANCGEPHTSADWKQPGMRKFLALCAEKPNQVSIGLHEYSFRVDKIDEGYPFKIGRFQYLFRACDDMGIPRPNILFGEWGWGKGDVPSPNVAMGHINQIAELYSRHPQILGAFIWYLGKYQDDIHHKTQKLIAPLTERTLQWRFTDPGENGKLDIEHSAQPVSRKNWKPGQTPKAEMPKTEKPKVEKPKAEKPKKAIETKRPLYTVTFTGYGVRDVGEASGAWYDKGNVQIPIVDGRKMSFWHAEGKNPYGDGKPWNQFGYPEGRIMWIDDPEKPPILGEHDRPFLNKQGRTYHLFAGVPFHVRYGLTETIKAAGTIKFRLEFVGDWVYLRKGKKIPKTDPKHGRIEFFAGQNGKTDWMIPKLLGDNVLTKEIHVEAGDHEVGFGVLTVWANGSQKGANGCFIKSFSAEFVPDEAANDGQTGQGGALEIDRTGPVQGTVLQEMSISPLSTQAKSVRIRFEQWSESEARWVETHTAVSVSLPTGTSRLTLQQLSSVVKHGESAINESLLINQKERGQKGKEEEAEEGDSGETAVPQLTPAQTTEPFKFERWPVEVKDVTQNFGGNYSGINYKQYKMDGHDGIDFRAPTGSKIFAVADGTVYRVHQKATGYGLAVRIKHAHGYKTIYGHLQKALVKEGQTVTAGQLIGLADSTGNSKGSHLHLSMKHDQAGIGQPMYAGYPYNLIDPTRFIEPLIHGQPLGIDISYAQGNILDFQRLAASGVKYAFIRVSNGAKYLSNKTHQDANYQRNVRGSRQNNIFFGNYYYLDDMADPAEQANHFLEQGDWECQLPAVLDVEGVYNEQLTAVKVETFVKAFRQRKPKLPLMIYTGTAYWNGLVPQSASWPRDLPLWIAQYTAREKPTLPHHWNKWLFWQFSSTSRWPGCINHGGATIKSNIDLNRFNGSLNDLVRLASDIAANQPTVFGINRTKTPSKGKAAEDGQRGQITAENGLRLRTEPSSVQGNKTIIRTLLYNSIVEIIEEVEDNQNRKWYKVHAGDDMGFVFGQYVRLLEEETGENGRKPTNSTLQSGMNINPDDDVSNPINGNALNGIGWVRFPFKLAARPVEAERDKISFSYAQYDPIVKGYAAKGAKSLIVLNQETVGGQVPWELRGHGKPYSHNVAEWEEYAQRFAKTAKTIVKHYKEIGHGDDVAYQIWNEGDKKNNPASAYLEAEHMAIILKAAAEAIRQVDPKVTLVFNGMATGPEETVQYLKACRRACGGTLPVDAVGIHPYTRWATRPPFDWGNQYGTLKDAFAVYRTHFPNMPFWITELGVADDNEIGSVHYETIADYLRDVCSHVAAEHTDLIKVLIWFAWADNMRNAGIVDRGGKPKEHVYEAFKDFRDGNL